VDFSIFNFINQFAGKWAWLDFLGIFFARYLEWVLILSLICLLFFNFKKWIKPVFLGFAAAGVSRFLITNLIRFLWHRPRPFVALNFRPLFDYPASEASFPSGHAAFYFALSAVIYFYNKKLGIIFLILTSLICLGRVFCGIHWPSDILAGAIIGIMCAWLFCKFFRKEENHI
jgi:undecaprenyl-diphosphatase